MTSLTEEAKTPPASASKYLFKSKTKNWLGGTPVSFGVLPEEIIRKRRKAFAQPQHHLVVRNIIHDYIHAIDDVIDLGSMLLEDFEASVEHVTILVDVLAAAVVLAYTNRVVLKLGPPLLGFRIILEVVGKVIHLPKVSRGILSIQKGGKWITDVPSEKVCPVLRRQKIERSIPSLLSKQLANVGKAKVLTCTS